jgi:hypothetical protein
MSAPVLTYSQAGGKRIFVRFSRIRSIGCPADDLVPIIGRMPMPLQGRAAEAVERSSGATQRT